jgi:hypothetical protein
VLRADASAKQLHARAGSGRLDDRGFHAGVVLYELLCNGGGERIDGGGTDGANLVTRATSAAASGLILTSGQRQAASANAETAKTMFFFMMHS